MAIVSGSAIYGFTHTAGTNSYLTNGTLTDVASAIGAASDGDIVKIPAGSFTWGSGQSYLNVNKSITLMGAGTGATTITLAPDGPSGTGAVIRISAAAVVRDFTVEPSPNVASFNTSTANGWRVTNISYNPDQSTNVAYFMRVNDVYGLIDNCTITGAAGNNELIFCYGPSDSWDSPNSLGSANAVYIEDCTFNGPGYVCDANSNARVVVRFCTINGIMKIDGHGLASNGAPPNFRGVRQMEVYNNHWTDTDNYWTAIEMRGGLVMVFDNLADGPSTRLLLRDYGYVGPFAGFNFVYETPFNYPLMDQIGTGANQVVSASKLALGKWCYIVSTGTTDFTSIGASSNSPGTYFEATGAATGTGTVVINGPTEPGYVFGNSEQGNPWPRTTPPLTNYNVCTTTATGFAVGATRLTLSSSGGVRKGNAIEFTGDPHRYLVTEDDPSGAGTLTIAAPGLQQAIGPIATTGTIGGLIQYQWQKNDPSATFSEADIVQSNRDFFSDAGFDVNIGVQVGTKAQMQAYTPSIVGYGWWVTDEGTWNKTDAPNTSGQLYVWNGAEWAVRYTPYSYPNPLRRPTAPSNLRVSP